MLGLYIIRWTRDSVLRIVWALEQNIGGCVIDVGVSMLSIVATVVTLDVNRIVRLFLRVLSIRLKVWEPLVLRWAQLMLLFVISVEVNLIGMPSGVLGAGLGWLVVIATAVCRTKTF